MKNTTLPSAKLHQQQQRANWTYSDVRSTLDNEAVGETVKANGATLLIQVDLLFRQEVCNSAAGTKSARHKKTKNSMYQLLQNTSVFSAMQKSDWKLHF